MIGRSNYRHLLTGMLLVLGAWSLTTGSVFALEKAEPKNSRTSEQMSEFNKVCQELKKLFLEYYPRAKVEQSGDHLEIAFKVGKQATTTGRTILAPKIDGILCDLDLKPGKYQSDKILPSRVNEMRYVIIEMAPYNEPLDKHLHTRLLFDPGTPEIFITRFKKLVDKFENQIEKKKTTTVSEAKVKTQTKTEPVTEAEAEVAGRPSEPDKPETTKEEKTDFGAPKLSSYSFSEGRFKVKLPGNPLTKYKDTAGMRFVQYQYEEPQGGYQVGYAILPGQIPYSQQGGFLNSISQSLIKSHPGKHEEHSLKWQGYPGRQIDLKVESKDKTKKRAYIYRTILVRRFLYIIEATGTEAWVASPAVKEVLASLEIKPELTSEEISLMRQREAQRESHRRLNEADSRVRNQRPRYNKDYEKSRADWNYRRRTR
ncbi:MAG: hypothetical protein KC652_24870 [Cyanobacteria bacterium HKST-UBA01]|nr:hypothetical protein [Cyanobacteria bacterium HKST-UBA01]